jgi:hypothetical protein
MNDGTFDFNLFIKESKDVLQNPKAYFAGLKTSGGMTEPLIKAVIYGAVSGAISFLWSILHIGAVSYGMFGGGAIGIMTFIWSVIGAIIGLFIGAVILLVISSICKGSTDFEANMRVTAACMVMMPVSSFFSFAGHFNLYFGVIVSLAISIYGIWLLYNGLVEALKASPETSKIVMYVLIALLVVVTLTGIGVRKRANRFMEDFNNKDLNELLKDTEKN